MLYLLTQGPVSVEVPVQGSLPLKSIERDLVNVLQVPEHAPQLSHDVHVPSTAKCYVIKEMSIYE